MFATIINAAAIVAGSLVGLLFKKGLPKRHEEIVFAGAGVATLVIGVQMAVKTSHLLAFSIALILGGLAGSLLDVEGGVERLGEALKRRFARGEDGAGFTQGFLNASVLFCSGAMAIVGSFKAGADGDYSILLTKSILDGILSVLFASAMGVGVLFSGFAVLVYQGLLTLASVWLKPYVSQLMLTELSALGGALIVMIGINLLGIKKLRTGDFLPALLLVVLLVLAMPYAPFL